jgi:hypothetical protein
VPPSTSSTPPPSSTPTTTTSELYRQQHDYATGNPATPVVEPFNVTAGTTTLRLNVSYEPGTTPIGSSVNVRTRVLDPGGTEVLSCARDACEKDVAGPAAGEWHVEYAGTGTARVTVVVSAVTVR